MPTETAIPLACDLTAINAEQRDQHIRDSQALLQVVEEVRETTDGYALRLPTNSGIFMAAAEFIIYERLCCPFFRFSLEAEPGQGAYWLTLSGGKGVKEFLRDNLISQISQ